MVEVVQIVELLLRGPSGWLVLGVSTAISLAAGYFGAKHRYKKVRETTHALLGEDGRFKTQNERDIDDMFASFGRHEQMAREMLQEMSESRGGARDDVAEHIRKVAQAMIDECVQMAEMNLAFRTKAAHREFMDRINERFRRAKQIRARVEHLQRGGTVMARAGRTLIRD